MKQGLFIIAVAVAVGTLALLSGLSGEPIVITDCRDNSASTALFTIANRTTGYALNQNQPRIQIESGEGWTNAALELHQPLSGLCVVNHDFSPNETRTYSVNLPTGNYAWRVETKGAIMFPIRWWHRYYDKGVELFGMRERKDEAHFSLVSAVRVHHADLRGAFVKP